MGSDDIVSDIEDTPVETGETKPIDKVSKELAAIRKKEYRFQESLSFCNRRLDTACWIRLWRFIRPPPFWYV